LGSRQRLEAGLPCSRTARMASGGGRQIWKPRYSTWTAREELEYLKDYTRGLEEALSAAKTRIMEIEKVDKTE
jgi:hypothetical protein